MLRIGRIELPNDTNTGRWRFWFDPALTGYDLVMNRSKLLAVLYAASLLVAVVVWMILYGRGVVFRLAGVSITPGIFTSAARVLVDVLIFLILW